MRMQFIRKECQNCILQGTCENKYTDELPKIDPGDITTGICNPIAAPLTNPLERDPEIGVDIGMQSDLTPKRNKRKNNVNDTLNQFVKNMEKNMNNIEEYMKKLNEIVKDSI